MEIAGLPLHFLVVHAAVVFTPLAALAAAVFAVLPKWRWLTRWPAVALTLIAFGSVWTARLSGNSYLVDNPELQEIVATHQSRGDLLSYLVIGFLVVTLLCAWALGGPSALANGQGERESTLPAADKILAAMLVLIAVAVLVQVMLTGDAGSRAVWG